jgi:hypothetical protein
VNRPNRAAIYSLALSTLVHLGTFAILHFTKKYSPTSSPIPHAIEVRTLEETSSRSIPTSTKIRDQQKLGGRSGLSKLFDIGLPRVEREEASSLFPAAGETDVAISSIEILDGMKNPWTFRIAQQFAQTLSFTPELRSLGGTGSVEINSVFNTGGQYFPHLTRAHGGNHYLVAYSLKTFFSIFEEAAQPSANPQKLRFIVQYKIVNQEIKVDVPVRWQGDQFQIEKNRFEKSFSIGGTKIQLLGRDTTGLPTDAVGLSWNFDWTKWFDADVKKADTPEERKKILKMSLDQLYSHYVQRGFII